MKGNLSHLVDANDVRFKLQPDGQDVGPERLLRRINNLGLCKLYGTRLKLENKSQYTSLRVELINRLKQKRVSL